MSQSAPRRFAIRDILPHSGEMLLVDELLDYGEDFVTCGLTIGSGTSFCESGRGVPAWVGIEYMAQTAGAYSGIADLTAGRRPAICLLLGARSYQAETPYFPIGAYLRVETKLVHRDESDLAAFDCMILEGRSVGGAVLARGDIKAYRPADIDAVIRGSRA
jgi:predicted hotdog family 3-hydroxylacyl-ACP dehydratase